MRSNNIWHLILLCIILMSSHIMVWGQPHNGEVYQKLVETFLSDGNISIKGVQGQPLEAWMPNYQIDSQAISQLIISPGVVTYERLGKLTYSRTVSVRLTVQDTSVRSMNQVFSDTLEKQIFKQVYKSSPEELRGDNPILLAKWVLPLVCISGSVGGVIALFFVRSR